MIDRKALLEDLQKLLPKIEADLLERSSSSEVPDVGRTLHEEYSAAQAADRTAQNFEDWRSDAITQVAAAWVLSCVFVRFLEDNQLVPTPKIAGPGEGLKRARDEHELYFRSHPTLTDRDYLLAVFDDLTKHAATNEVFGEHNPIRDLPNWLSGDAAGALIAFFQKIEPTSGVLVHDFSDPDWDTRFLGDLYQDLSEAARKKYALLQTPVFVEEFILDRTLDPAIEEFGLARPGYETRLLPDGRLSPGDRFKMIDPACGSGHFLLGSFPRLLERWRKKEPGTRTAVLVQRALDSVHGVDLNPFAIAIARFRLLLAALKECGVRRLSVAPGFTLHLACGDSLLHGSLQLIQQTFDVVDQIKHVYHPEDPETLRELLHPGAYHAVVANPPYITPKDRALNQAYRIRYTTCLMKYSMAVPFLERITSLAVKDGYTGQITANSFMGRSFGKRLIEDFLPELDLTHIIDSKGAYITGHDTPTVILFLRNRPPSKSTIRTVLGIEGERGEPPQPEKGNVWLAIKNQIDIPNSLSKYVSVADSPRSRFAVHPWSLGGGGASELKEEIDNASSATLSAKTDSIGITCFTLEDDMFMLHRTASRRHRLSRSMTRRMVEGQVIRDWLLDDSEVAVFPYDDDFRPIADDSCDPRLRFLWVGRTVLSNNKMFGDQTKVESGLSWFEYGRLTTSKLRDPKAIILAAVATHNHFLFDEARDIFKQSTIVIKLPSESSAEDHFRLLAVLNSSLACFWMKQTFIPKGTSTHDIGTDRGRPEADRYDFAGTGLGKFPLPEWEKEDEFSRATALAKALSSCGSRLKELRPKSLVALVWKNSGNDLKKILDDGESQHEHLLRHMVFLQEELDWEVYHHCGLMNGELRTACGQGEILPNQRPFNWENNEAPKSLDAALVEVYEARRRIIVSNTRIGLIERSLNKRPWLGRQGVYGRTSRTYPEWRTEALAEWLCDCVESYFDFDGRLNDDGKRTARVPIGLLSVGRLADIARQDTTFLEVGGLYRDDSAFDVTRLVTELVESESVPLLPILRYKPSGLRKRGEWEKTWDLQRQEDAIDARTKLAKDHPQHLSELDAAALKKKLVGTIPVPPKYTSADFLKSDFWRLRGKLDVAKERWVSFPHCEGEDGTLMVAWAGYDHLQLARAISAYYVDVQERLGGRDDPRLVPLLACLIELLPWLKQWHNDIDPEFGVPMGDYFEGFLQEESRNLGLTLDEIKAWQPAQRPGARGRRRANG